MFRILAVFVVPVTALVFLLTAPVHAQQHRATRLGNPATRFANPLKTPQDLQNMLRSEALRADVDFIARACGYRGEMEDLRRAAALNNIHPLRIPVGSRLPAMSSRKDGKAILLQDVLWAGQEPIDAYEFHFTSQGRRYRLVSPKACANFWVEEHGPELRPALTLACDVPSETTLRRPVQVCLTVKNVGNASEPILTVTLPIPPGATFVRATGEGKRSADGVVWQWQNVAAKTAHQVCAVFDAPQLSTYSFKSTARGQRSAPAQTRCETRVVGIPAVQLEVVDLKDPIEVGDNETYEVRVLNQGSVVLTNIKLTCTLESGQRFVLGTGSAAAPVPDSVLTLEKLSVLDPKATGTWRVIVKTLTPGDVRFVTELTCDQFHEPIKETEATQQY